MRSAFMTLALAVTHGSLWCSTPCAVLRQSAFSSRRDGATGQRGGALCFGQILLDERTDMELAQLEEAIACPSRAALRVWQLKRHKHALDTLNTQIDLTWRRLMRVGRWLLMRVIYGSCCATTTMTMAVG